MEPNPDSTMSVNTKRTVAWLLLVLNLITLQVVLLPQVWSAGPPEWRPRIVILVGIDTLRADRLGAYGYARSTSPNIDQIAREGTVFERCYSPAHATQFSFPAIFTGLHAQHGLQAKVLRQDVPTVATVLGSYGFRTAAYTAGGYVNNTFGLSRGFDIYQTPFDFCTLHETMPRAIEWLEAQAGSTSRGLLFVHGYDPHVPYAKPLHFSNLFNRHPTDMGRLVVRGQYLDALLDYTYREPSGRSTRLTAEDCDYISSAYDGSVAWADLQVGLLLSAIHRLGLSREVLLVVFADHGEELFDRGNLGHGKWWYEEDLHVPLVFWGPGGIPGGVRIPQVVEEIDLFPTIVDLAGIHERLDVAGRSLGPVILGRDRLSDNSAALSAVGPRGTLRTDRYRLIAPVEELLPPAKPNVQLYDLLADPQERVNLADRPENKVLIAELRQEMARRYARHL